MVGNDWSEEDIAARKIDTLCWSGERTEISDEEVRKLIKTVKERKELNEV